MSAHVMMDLETLGTRPGCVVLSVGACTFDPFTHPDDPWPGKNFSANIDNVSCQDAGLTIDHDTLAWWNGQPLETREAFTVDARPLWQAVSDFHVWFSQVGGSYLWCNGAGFDEPIWRAAARAAGFPGVPWKYWNVRDTRTAWHLGGVNPTSIPRDGLSHHALDDARHQARCVTLAVSRLKVSPAFAPELFGPDASGVSPDAA